MSTARIFVSYSHEDARWVDEGAFGLIQWLARSLAREDVRIWCDPKLKEDDVGRSFKLRIEEEIGQSHLALLLISQDFVSSQFIHDYELPWIRARVDAGGLRIVPILVGPVLWEEEDDLLWLAERQMLPGKPASLIEYTTEAPKWERARVEILGAVRRAVREIRKSLETSPENAKSASRALAPLGAEPRKLHPTQLKNTLGQTLLRATAEYLPPGFPRSSSLYVAAACVSNRDWLEYVRAGGPEPECDPESPNRQVWIGGFCPPELLTHPVTLVSQNAALGFCAWLTKQERDQGTIPAGAVYGLPSFEQWKAFAGAATTSPGLVVGRSWPPQGRQPTERVDSGERAGLGLCHTLGNVFQWCSDRTNRDLKGPDGRLQRAVSCALAVGGGWASDAEWLAQQVQKGTFGAIWRSGGRPMKDGGIRLVLQWPAR